MSTINEINTRMDESRKYYVYAWIDANNNLPFYIGVGSHISGIKLQRKYARAYHIHYADSNTKRLAFCQIYANKLKSNDNPHIVKILHDNLTLDERLTHERELIELYGRRTENTGILCNITEGGEANPMHCPAIREKHAKIMKNIINIPTMTPELIQNKIIKTTHNMNDPAFREIWDSIISSPENIEKLRSSNSKSKRIVFNGIEYRSISELSRFLKISKALLLYRIKHCIPLDANPNKGNKFLKNKGPSKNRTTRKCISCGIVKELCEFSEYNRGSRMHHSKTCIRCLEKVVDA